MANVFDNNVVSKKEQTIIKIQETINYLVIPVAGVAAIWGADISVYCVAISQALNSLLAVALLFVK